jgi:hypothetical protein
MGEIISMRIEQFREWLAFKIYPDLRLYIKVSPMMGELNENDRVVELIEQSKLKNKKAVIDLVKHQYKPINITELLNDASEDQIS